MRRVFGKCCMQEHSADGKAEAKKKKTVYVCGSKFVLGAVKPDWFPGDCALPDVAGGSHYRGSTLASALSRCCELLPIKAVILSPFIYCNLFIILPARRCCPGTVDEPPHFGEGAYAIMIIIIKKILMCLVFVTQLLIVIRAAAGTRAAAKTKAAAHLSRGFRGSQESQLPELTNGRKWISPRGLMLNSCRWMEEYSCRTISAHMLIIVMWLFRVGKSMFPCRDPSHIIIHWTGILLLFHGIPAAEHRRNTPSICIELQFYE